MIYLKTAEEIELMRHAAQLVSRTLGLVASEIKEGVSLKHLDKIAEEFIRDNGGVPVFKGYNGFPATLCLSVNEQVVHGIPSDKVICSGDIISVDCGVKKQGFVGDHAYTFCAGEIKKEVQDLVRVTKESLYIGIEEVKTGNRIGDVSYAIQTYAEKHGYGVVRELVGHGVGKNLHEKPEVPNYGKRGSGAKIQNGLTIAIEPMINMGTKDVIQLKDGWTIITKDKKPSAHFEHDVAVVNGKADILSTFSYAEEAMNKNNFLVKI
ncbi:MAG TPA: type I methionyl aminopeptidase [Bacteroidia bacterium]